MFNAIKPAEWIQQLHVAAADRDIRRLVGEAGFEFTQVDQYYMEGAPKFGGFMTRGVATAIA
jgi:hypothetical protein